MNGVSDYVVAIDLGSSKIVGCLGKKEVDGKIRILAMEQVPVKTEVSRGVVHNIEEVSKSVQDLIQLLSDNKDYPCKIDQIYVGLNGYTIRTVDINCTTNLSGEELVTERHLDELYDETRAQVPENLDVMEVFTQEFLLDGKLDLNPVGSMPQRIEGHYKIVGGKSTIMRNLEACLERIPCHHENVLGPLASAEAILRLEDKSKGSVAIDFGAETTSVCVYKGNLVRYISVLPFGGSNITKDLLQLNIDDEEAENLKLSKGTALHFEDQDPEEREDVNLEKTSKFDKEVNDIIVARIEEIVENLWAQIRYSGIEPQKLAEGLVITGGASKLPGLIELLRKKTDMPVRLGNAGEYLTAGNFDQYAKPEFALAIGILLLGKEGCCSACIPVEPEVKKIEVPMEQTLGGFDSLVKEEPKLKVQKVHKEPKEPKKPKNNPFRGIFKTIFDDEDL